MYGGNNTYVNTTNHIDQNSQNRYNLPSPVINNAETSIYPNALSFYHFPDDASTVYHIFLYFADFQNTSTREFDIYFGEKLMVSYFRPKYLSATTVYSILPQSKYHVNVSLLPTARSILPPLLNAYEVYSTKELPNMFTYTGDVDAMKDFKATYRVKRNWEGDPCIPRVFLWEGLDCSNASITDPPRITFLTLTHSKLAGEISPSVFNLKMLQHLDLSFNNLTGEVPEFLAHMSNLTFINLSENNLSGKVPLKLLEKKDMGFLNLRLEGNPHLCKEKSCAVKKKKLFPIIIGLAAGLSVLSIIIIWIYIIRRRRSLQQEVHVDSNGRGTTLFKAKDQNFSYSEVVRITQNFKTVLGSGGFGKVYQGCLEGNQVAVKILSMSSGQGYKQFKAEAELLTKVHHRNLTSLVGYCHEGDKLGLIYEFMANGDLQSQLSEQNHNSLSWELRLDIALDAAQGLEYMHNGCKPPIIHRDVKSTNILLDDNFHAKLGDFGLSRVFATEGSDNLSTSFAGTLGYLDPEYNMNKKSDVFSFGVVLLEIITGKPAISRNEQKMHLSEWVSDTLTTKGDISNVVDPRIGGDFDINSMRKAVDLAMECVSVASNARPKMYNVVMELKRCLDMEKSRFETGDRSDQANYDDSSEINLLNVATTEVSLYAR